MNQLIDIMLAICRGQFVLSKSRLAGNRGVVAARDGNRTELEPNTLNSNPAYGRTEPNSNLEVIKYEPNRTNPYEATRTEIAVMNVAHHCRQQHHQLVDYDLRLFTIIGA